MHHGGINGAVWVIQGAAFPQLLAAPLPPSSAPLLPPLLLCRLAATLLPVSAGLSLPPPLTVSRHRRAERAHRVPASSRAARPGARTRAAPAPLAVFLLWLVVLLFSVGA